MSDVQQTADEKAVEIIKQTTGADVKLGDLEAITLKRFENLYENLLKESHTLSARQLIRGLFNAVNIGVDCGLNPKLVTEEEARFGGYLGQLLDLRNVVLSINLQKQEKETQDVTTETTNAN